MSQIRIGDRAIDPDQPLPYRPAEGIQVSTTTRGQGGARTHFVRSRRGELCQLGEEEYFLFTLIDGRPSFTEIQREFRSRFAGDLSPRHFQSFIDELLSGGIVERIETEDAAVEYTTAQEEAAPARAAPAAPPSPDPPNKPAPQHEPHAYEPASDTEQLAAAPPVGRVVSLQPLFLALAWLATPLRYFACILVPAASIAAILLFADPERITSTLGTIDWDGVARTLSHGANHVGRQLRAVHWEGLGPGLAVWAADRIAAVEAFDWATTGDVISAAALRLAAWAGTIDAPGSASALVREARRGTAVFQSSQWRPVAAVLVAALTLLVLPRIAAGVAAAYHGAPPETFRLRLRAWLLLWFTLDGDRIAALPHKGRTWCHGAALLTRLALFAGGTFLWAAPHNPASQSAITGLALSGLALWSFLLNVTPLWPGEGRRWLAAFFDEPGLDRRRGPQPMRGRGFQVVAVIIGLTAIAGAALASAGYARTTSDIETGALLLAMSWVSGLLWLHVAWAAVGPLRPIGSAYARKGPGGLPSFGRPVPSEPAAADVEVGPVSLDERLYAGRQGWPESRSPIILAAVVATLIAIAFLPYPYESGGAFSVVTYDRVNTPVRVSGEVSEVLVREGDWVTEGQVIGALGDWVEVHGLATAQAQLETAMANLQNLLISPKPEEVIVAQRQYEQALSRIGYSKSEYERNLALLKTNDTSVKAYESALSTYQQDLAAVQVTKANYDLVRVGPTAAQIAAARAQAHSAAEAVSYAKDQLERTRIRATETGRVVTPDPQLMMGQHLTEGTNFVSLENHKVAHIEVQVPEYDIRDIHLGSLVRAKAWGYEYTTWRGKTVLIAPDAQPNSTLGNVVRVVAEVPNPDGLLRPTMSGYAKVETVDMPVWVAFTRAMVRFLLIEVWYWIP